MLLQRMSSSNGPKYIQKELGHTRNPSGSWDIMEGIKDKFPEFYRYILESSRKNS